MTEANPPKCSYFNKGYCKFIKKENGCRYAHPTECCKVSKCRDKGCPLRHPKKCRHGEKCRYQTKCLYKHSKDNTDNTVQSNQSNEDKTLNLAAEVKNLKAEIVNLKLENDRKINALVNLHLLELQDLQRENISIKNNLKMSYDKKHKELVEAHAEEVKGLKFQNEQLQETLAFKESLDVTLASKDEDLVKVQAELKQLKAANNDLRLYAKQKIDDKDILLQNHQQQIQELQTETYKLKRMML